MLRRVASPSVAVRSDRGFPRTSGQGADVEEPAVLRDREAVGHAGDVVGDAAGPLGLAPARLLDAPLGIVRERSGVWKKTSNRSLTIRCAFIAIR